MQCPIDVMIYYYNITIKLYIFLEPGLWILWKKRRRLFFLEIFYFSPALHRIGCREDLTEMPLKIDCLLNLSALVYVHTALPAGPVHFTPRIPNLQLAMKPFKILLAKRGENILRPPLFLSHSGLKQPAARLAGWAASMRASTTDLLVEYAHMYDAELLAALIMGCCSWDFIIICQRGCVLNRKNYCQFIPNKKGAISDIDLARRSVSNTTSMCARKRRRRRKIEFATSKDRIGRRYSASKSHNASLLRRILKKEVKERS